MPTFSAGMVPTAGEMETAILAGTVIARASRATSSTAATGSQGVLRLDGVAAIGGRHYQIRCSNLLVTSNVTGDRGSARLAMDTTGASATTASTIYAIANSPNIDSATDGEEVTCSFDYTPPSNQTLSIILFTTRLSGTGSVRLLVASNSTIDIEVVDCGLDIGDTGVDL